METKKTTCKGTRNQTVFHGQFSKQTMAKAHKIKLRYDNGYPSKPRKDIIKEHQKQGYEKAMMDHFAMPNEFTRSKKRWTLFDFPCSCSKITKWKLLIL